MFIETNFQILPKHVEKKKEIKEYEREKHISLISHHCNRSNQCKNDIIHGNGDTILRFHFRAFRYDHVSVASVRDV